MAAKVQLPQDNTGSSVLSQMPPSISLASPVLASTISLPDHPLIAYSVFTCAPATVNPLDQLELGRRVVLRRNSRKAFLESLLPIVHVGKDACALYVFALGSTHRTCEAHDALAKLEFDTLTLSESSSFTPTTIYPCSAACSSQQTPCQRCLEHTLPPPSGSPPQLLPRTSLRLPLTLFLQATRDRLIDDVAEASKSNAHGRSVARLKGGFLLGSFPTSSEWGSGWESHAHSRPLIACNLQVHMAFSASAPSSARLMVHPVMRPTYYLPLHHSLPLPAGTPIVLLPHGVPAYYLNTYSGPAAALTAQFEEALLGLGAANWNRSPYRRYPESDPQSRRTCSRQEYPLYIIAWLAVQNKQGEDKGMPVIWPATLCVSYHASSPSSHARSPLSYIPELPAQLQSSPPPPASAVPATFSFTTAASSAIDIPASASTPQSQAPPLNAERLTPSFQRRPSILRSSPTSDSLRAFRSLTLARKPYSRQMKNVASEVSGYVESVVKERERERERLRRERQEQELAKERAKLASTQPAPPAEPPTPAPISQKPSEPRPADSSAHPAPAPSPPSLPAEAAEPESQPTVESDHSGDSLFSPPDATIDLPSTEEATPAAAEEAPADAAVPAAADETPAVPPVKAEAEASSMGFDPFSGFDGSWGQQSSSYMEANLYDMDYPMNMDSLGGARTNGAAGGSFDMDDGFGVFTEDDFDFFDAPSAQRGAGSAAHPMAMDTGVGMTTAAGPPPSGLTPLVTGDGPLSGPGPPSAGVSHPSPWIAHLGDPFTPRNTGDIHGMVDHSIPPDLLPPSPTRTPSTHSAPATPSVQLSDPYKTHEGRKSSLSALGPNIFDPIPFASSHRQADGKYAVGKFALPSPPADQDRAEALIFNAAGPPALSGWKFRYSAVTDPRIGVVKKLIGVKRKVAEQGMRDQRRSSAWDFYRDTEDWQSSSPPSAAAVDSESEDEQWMEDEEMTSAPRPSTPPPSYLPLGPTLLQTHFHHSYLLPLCTPLRPPGATAASPPGNAPPISVPTPVSPAAILGAASEKSKSLEAAGQVLVKEVVENPMWSEAWRANASLALTPPVLPAKLWQADAKYISHLLGAGTGLSSPATLQDVFGESDPQSAVSIRTLQPPMLAVGKDEAVVQLSTTSLRFWEKLGLTPRAGQKDVTAFVFYEGTDEDRDTEFESWLCDVSTAYSAKNFGSHTAGISSHCTKPGLVPTRFDTLRKTLTSFVSTIPTRHPHLVFYIATPSHIISPSSTVLRQILSAVRRFYKAYPGGDILVHFVPESLVEGIHTHPGSSLAGLDDFVCSVYDRLLVPVTRAMSRKFFALSAPATGYFEAPAYALISSWGNKSHAELVSPQVSFALESSVSSLDVMNRHMLLHVGYQVSSCGRWILAACIDAEGEAHELKTWLTPDDNVEAFLVNQVWAFVHEFARRANIEWRIVITKLGAMAYSEIHAWVSHLDSVVSMSSEVPPIHVTLLAVDNENPWTFLAPPEIGPLDIIRRNSAPAVSPRASPRSSHAIFSDASCATYALSSPSTFTFYPAYTTDRSSKCISASLIPGSSDLPYIPDLDDDSDAPSHQLPPADTLRVPAWRTVVCAPSMMDHTSVSTIGIFQLHVTRSLRSTYEISSKKNEVVDASQVHTEHMNDIVRNFNDLAVLARLRWKLRADPALPFHLAALEVMRAALSGGASDS